MGSFDDSFVAVLRREHSGCESECYDNRGARVLVPCRRTQTQSFLLSAAKVAIATENSLDSGSLSFVARPLHCVSRHD